MDRKKALNYYRREDILDTLVNISDKREISAELYNGSFTSRPKIIQYRNDVLNLVRKGAVAFHTSVERWKNPMELDTSMSRDQLDRLRTGWDLILDIDSALDIEAGKTALKLILEFLESYGIDSYGVKFSGRRGFHILVPWECFPGKVDFENTENQFPEIPQAIAGYIRKNIRDDLLQELKDLKGGFSELINEVEGSIEELDPFHFVDVEKDWGKRHLFRMPYSLHRSTGLVSYPLRKNEIKDFEMKDAKPENIETGKKFLKIPSDSQATELLIDSLDWFSKRKKKDLQSEEKSEDKSEIKPEDPVNKKKFPPCIKLILEGISDGRKRSVFILINFLRRMSWDWDKIEETLYEWNEKNDQKLRENYIETQIKWFKRQDRKMLPPSCDNELYYLSFNVCKPDEKCEEIKNPVVYPFKK